MAKVLCFGSLNIDYIYQVPHFVGAGDGQQPAQPQMPSKVEYIGLLVSFMARSPLETEHHRGHGHHQEIGQSAGDHSSLCAGKAEDGPG